MEHKYSDEKNVQLVIGLLKAHGIRKIVASPGTTNITFIGSLMHDTFFQIYSSVDERSAAYIACGLAEAANEPVVISCTGATASRNYFPGLTEAYYRKLPVLAITSTREEYKIGHLIDQQIDRSQQPKDTVVCSEHLPLIKDDEDWWNCTIKVNRAILALKSHGGGPAHINLPTHYSSDFSVEKLPDVRKIERLFDYDKFPSIVKRTVAIFIGSHRKMTRQENNAIDSFCEAYNATVFCDICSGYRGKYGVSMFGIEKHLNVDLLVHIGEVSCVAYGCKPKEVWRVSEDGELRDTFRSLTKVFAMPEKVFFEKMSQGKDRNLVSSFVACTEDQKKIYNKILQLPFCNNWIALNFHDKLPLNSVVHLGIVSSFFAWNRFKLDPSIDVTCNQGGFGIDGNISTILVQALANPDRLHFLMIRDLAFFYDMNALGNRHFPKNIRILLVNNGCGAIFRKASNIGSIFGKEADSYISAGGHFGHQSPLLVKAYVTALGFEYIPVCSKEDMIEVSAHFFDSSSFEHPMIIEAFVDVKDEILGEKLLKPSGLKGTINDIVGDNAYRIIGNILKGGKVNMNVDRSNNK